LLPEDFEKIRNGEYEPILSFYKLYRKEFIQWGIIRFSCSEEEAKDVFQVIMVGLFQNIQNGKLKHLSSDLKTYLWAMGKNHLLNLIKKNKKIVTFSSIDSINILDSFVEATPSKEEDNHNKEMVRKYLSVLEEKEQQVLRLYYIHRLSMSAIAEKLGYKNADVAKKKKYEVIKKLAKLLNHKLKLMMLV